MHQYCEVLLSDVYIELLVEPPLLQLHLPLCDSMALLQPLLLEFDESLLAAYVHSSLLEVSPSRGRLDSLTLFRCLWRPGKSRGYVELEISSAAFVHDPNVFVASWLLKEPFWACARLEPVLQAAWVFNR